MNEAKSLASEESNAAVSRSFWQETWRQFCRRKLAVASLIFIIFLAVVAIFSPAIAGTKPVVCKYKGRIYFPAMGYFNPSWENAKFHEDKFYKRYPKNLKEKDPESWAIWPLVYQDPYRAILEDEWPGRPANPTSSEGFPSRVNFFGTHHKGIDVFAQMVHGTRVALMVGFVAMGIAATIGILAGATAGYFGSWVDMVISRIIEVFLCIPSLVLILALLAVVEQPTIWHVMAVLGVTRWTPIARLTRAEFLKLKQLEYVTAARALGANQIRIMFRHILPNSLAPVLVPIVFGIASAILVEAGLSVLGFGIEEPNPSWGSILKSGRDNYEYWWTIVFPGLAVFSTVLAYNLIGEGLQEATDPKLRESGK